MGPRTAENWDKLACTQEENVNFQPFYFTKLENLW